MDPKKMKVSELRAELEKRGLSLEGKKPDLVNRLQARLDEEEFGLVATTGTESPASAAAGKASVATTLADEAAGRGGQPEKPAVEESSLNEKESPAKLSVNEPASKEEHQANDANAKSSNAKPIELKPKTEGLSFEEKKKLRAERFGLSVAGERDSKKQKSGDTAKMTQEELEKRKQRADRFGIVDESEVEAEKKKKRAERFGKTDQSEGKATSGKGSKVVDDDDKPPLSKEEILKLLERGKKFGKDSDERTEELKAMLRKYRFSESS